MDKALKEKWVKALRSGKYEQGNGWLRKDGKYCCLGVLCDVQGRRWGRDVFGEWTIGTGMQADSGGETNEKLARDVGGASTVRRLIELNDNGRSFAKIADYVERNL